jgi:hypothetical protein
MLQMIFCHIAILIHAVILYRNSNSRCFVTPCFKNRLFVRRYIIPEPHFKLNKILHNPQRLIVVLLH